MLKKALFIFLIHYTLGFTSQVPKVFNWSDAGYKGVKPTYNQTVNIMNYGGNNTNSGANNVALGNAITALNNKGGVIYFPKGVYSFTTQVNLNRDSITFKGAGYDSTILRFNLNGVLNNCINVYGLQNNSDTTSFMSAGVRDSNWVNVLNASPFQSGDWVYLQTTDNSYMASSWAYGSLGQVMQVKSVNGNKLTFYSPFRFYYKLSLQPKIKKINPKKAIGFECFKIQRLDATTNQTSLFSFDKAVQCWIHGIEGDSTNYAHVELNRSSNIDITNSWFHHAFAYGGSGQAYGIAFQYSSNECKIENNIFQNLRHSMLFQAGANGNICGYNYSFNPYWTQFPLPSNSAGDIVFHGNFPFANLCEGNINQNTVIDDSHGKNGSYNTLYRNRSETYGVFMNNAPASDSVQFAGLEITNSTFGQYVINGNGHYQFANKILGALTPAGTGSLNLASLYYSNSQKPLCFNPGSNNWPIIGIPNGYNTGTNAAKDRAMQGIMATCACTQSIVTYMSQNLSDLNEIIIYPNPATEVLNIKSSESVTELNIYSTDGQLVYSYVGKHVKHININFLTPGIYFIGLKSKQGIKTIKLIKN